MQASKFMKGQKVSFKVPHKVNMPDVKVTGIIRECRMDKENKHCYLLMLVTGDFVVKSESVLTLSK